ncbi:alpha-mannosidase [Pseudaestuariivita sp.]|uniref:alpha-mannosidase n=1 Tax=Pseudaestuariivita sp. TaxID=2211669 RepID=UPI004058D22A
MNHNLRFTAEKIAKRIALIAPHVHRARAPLPEFTFEELEDAEARPGSGVDRGTVAWDSYWVGQDTHFVLRAAFTVPTDFTCPALHLPLGVAGDIFTHPEALLSIDGEVLCSADRYHRTIRLDPALADGKPHQLMLHGWTGLTGWPPDPTSTARLQIHTCHVVDIDSALREFLLLAECALDVAKTFERGDRHRDRILQTLDAAFLALDTRDPLGARFRKSVPHALSHLQHGLESAGAPNPERLHAIGHAHMDIAYLWPIAQIRQKNARTYSNVLRLMEQDPDFTFSHSQPQLYAYTEEDFPDIFEAIKARVAEGRWEVMGGMWVEPDCNIPGSEALVRQILLGRQYYRDTFGDVETPVLWLPDTFGFPWSLPQLMKLAGLEYFVTNKLNWNQYNRMPSSTLWWQGIDGTRVLAQFLTTPREVQHLPFPTNYKSDLSAAEVIGTVENATSGPDMRDFLICYGYGDGGGGPNEDLVAKARAFAAMPGAPQVQMGRLGPALKAIRKQARRLPVWNDELYLEGHRGTLTTQAWIKRANRRTEEALHAAEAALVMAYPMGAPDGLRADLTRAWRMLCLNQFHDILTGTSIPAVFVKARADFAEMAEITERVQRAAMAQMLNGQGHSLFNPAPVSSQTLLLVPKAVARDHTAQEVTGGTLIAVDPVAGYGLAPLGQCTPRDTVTLTRQRRGVALENAHLRLEIDNTGALTRVLHRPTGREVLAPDQDGNQLWFFEDRPISWDAWDIDVFHDDRCERVHTPARIEVLEEGPLRASLRLTWSYNDSAIRQTIRLAAGSPRVDFETEVDWAEQHTLLKVAFPVDVHASRARYDIQWGDIERATHRNTSWDYARFEVPAQKWADLSETGFGVAVLNDCKYGYDIRENAIRLTLVKSSTNPDPGADQGLHRFTYSLLPHAADLPLVRAEARRLNAPLQLIAGTPKTPVPPPVTADVDHVTIETLKPAEDGNGFIVRLYEAQRRRGPVTLSFAQPMASVTEVSLLEDPLRALPITDGTVTLTLTPYQIVSLRCVPATS